MIKDTLAKSFNEKLSLGIKSETERTKKIYDERLSELKEKKSSKYMEKLKNQLLLEKQKLQQGTLFKEMNKEKLDKVRQLEINLEKIQTEKITYLENILKDEKEKILNKVLPKRFKLNYFDVYPLGIEIILNEKIVS